MSELRSWEDFELDCLLNILERLGLGSLLLDVPFVCKSWFKASLKPSCWKHLDFTEFSEEKSIFRTTKSPLVCRFIDENQVKNFSAGGLVRLIVARGNGKIASLILPRGCKNDDLDYIADKCPELKSLSLKRDVIREDSVIFELIKNWKLLQELTVEIYYKKAFLKMVSEIGLSCKNFESLAIGNSKITEDDAISISIHLPEIKNLCLLDCAIEQKSYEIIIMSCKNLEFLDLNKCYLLISCHEVEWVEISNDKLAEARKKKLKHFVSHMKTFKLDASYAVYHDELSPYDFDSKFVEWTL